jgi:cysteine-rich repeat protein
MPSLPFIAPDPGVRLRAPAALLLHVICLIACTPTDQASASESTSSSTTAADSTNPTTTGGSSSTGDLPTTTTEDPTTSAAETTPVATCPDGQVDDDELCDDGNTINGDGCNADCQPSATQLWEYRPQERGSGQIYGLAVDTDGSIVAGGRGGGGVGGWVARFSPELALQWQHNYGAMSGLVRDVAVGDGTIYAVGSQYTDVDSHDLWVARLDADGTLEWEDTVSSGVAPDWATQAALLDGDLVVTGHTDADKLWTRRYGADGTIQWTATEVLGIPYKDIFPLGPGLVVTADAVIVGSTGNDTIVAPELLVAYTLAGAPAWTTQLPGTYGYINALAAMPGGDLALASVDNFATLTVRRVSGTDTVAWSSAACAGSIARDIAVDSQGDIVVIGDGPGGDGRNIRLCKFAGDGTLRWGKDIDGGLGDDLGYAVAIAPLDRVVAGGVMLTGPNERDAWLAVFAP